MRLTSRGRAKNCTSNSSEALAARSMSSSRKTHHQSDATAWAIAFVVAAGTSTTAALFVDSLWHWFLLPVTCCGILVGVDAARWARGQLDVLEPRALIALFGLHFFFLAPLLHVALDFWPRYVPPAVDWNHSLGVLSTVNLLGLGLYRLVIALKPPQRSASPRLMVNVHVLTIAASAAIFTGVVVLGFIVYRLGGPAGYLATVNQDAESLAGMGWLFLIGESWPIILLATVLVRKRDWLRRHRGTLVMLALGFIAVQFLAGGLRGSRSNTVWPTLIALGMIHLIVTPITRRILVWGMVGFVGFMWVYGFYKAVGTDVVGALSGRTSIEQLTAESGRGLPFLLLEDFGRAGTQVLVVDRLSREIGPAPVYGETYLGGLTFLFPEQLLGDPPRDKVIVGTDTLYGSGAYASGTLSTRIYGLVGEGMLNFGLVGGILAFAALGLFVRVASRLYVGALRTKSLAVCLIAPAFGIACVLALASDLDNLVWFMVKQVLPLAAVVWIARARPMHGGGNPRDTRGIAEVRPVSDAVSS